MRRLLKRRPSLAAGHVESGIKMFADYGDLTTLRDAFRRIVELCGPDDLARASGVDPGRLSGAATDPGQLTLGELTRVVAGLRVIYPAPEPTSPPAAPTPPAKPRRMPAKAPPAR